jgi:hypothetical protein
MNYKHGLPFSELLGTNIDDLIDRVDNRKASLIIIDGGVGEGKTTLLVHLLNYINAKRNQPPIDYTGPQLAMGGADFLKKMRECHEKGLPCIGYDEAGDFNRRGALTGFNAMLNRTFETFRAFKCIVVVCLPNFAVLDNQLFDNKIPRMLLHLSGRSHSYGNFDAFGLNEMEWLKFWIGKCKVKNYAWSRVYPNFYGHFLDLDPEESAKLDKVTTKTKLKILEKAEVKIEGFVSYADISSKINRPVFWCRNAINQLKLKSTKKIGKVKYFDKNVLDQLEQHSVELIENDKRGKYERGNSIK